MNMHTQKKIMLGINIIGGMAVLSSYAIGLWTHLGQADALWGKVPQQIRPYYVGNMPFVALGYLVFTYFLLFRLNPEKALIAKHWRFGRFNLLYVLILVPSAMWMPLTFAVSEHFTPTLWFAVRFVLTTVGLASLGMFAAFLSLEPKEPRGSFWLAVAGNIPFFIQTAILDAILWTSFYLG